MNPSDYASSPPASQPGGQYGVGTISSPPPPPPPPKSGGGSFSPQPVPLGAGQPTIYRAPERSLTQDSYRQPPQQHAVLPPAVGGQAAPSVGNQWLPDILRNKSKADLETIRNDPALLSSLLYAPSTAHPSLPASQKPLQEQLNSNLQLASQLLALESQIQNLRSSLTPSLLRVSTLERQFRAKQEAMDDALAPWAPKAVHTRLGQGVQEQEAFCNALEESFLDAPEVAVNGSASDREISEWLKKYRESRKVLELRREKKMRLEEGRVGGWK